MKAHCGLVAFIVTLTSCMACAASGIPREVEQQVGNAEILALSRWWISSETEPVLAIVSEPILADQATSKTSLSFFAKRNQWVRIGEFPVGHVPLNMVVTTQQDGHLVTQWATGSAHLVKVFRYSSTEAKPINVVTFNNRGYREQRLKWSNRFRPFGSVK